MKTVCYMIPLPMSLEDSRRAFRYSLARSQTECSDDKDGAVVMEYEQIAHEKFGSGMEATNHYSFASRLPSWVTFFMKASSLVVVESTQVAGEWAKTELSSSFMAKMHIGVETRICSRRVNNMVELFGDAAKGAEVKVIDIMHDRMTGSKDPYPDAKPAEARSAYLGNGPFESHSWFENVAQDGKLCFAYKMVTAAAPYFGIQGKAEKLIQEAVKDLSFVTHRNMWLWADNWGPMSQQQVEDFESETMRSAMPKATSSNSIKNDARGSHQIQKDSISDVNNHADRALEQSALAQ